MEKLKAEQFKPVNGYIKVKSEAIKSSGIILLDESKKEATLMRFTVTESDNENFPVGAIVWPKPHAGFIRYHEDKDGDTLFVPYQDIAGVKIG